MDSNCLDPQPKQATIVQGEDKILNVRLYNPDGTPLDVTQATEIVALFSGTLNGYPSIVEKKLSTGGITIHSGPGGWILPALAPADTKQLIPGLAESFEVRVTIGGLTSIIQFNGALIVLASQFPSV